VCLCVAGAYLCLETHSTLNLGSRWQRSYGRPVSPARVNVLKENQRGKFTLCVCENQERETVSEKNTLINECECTEKDDLKMKKLRFISRAS